MILNLFRHLLCLLGFHDFHVGSWLPGDRFGGWLRHAVWHARIRRFGVGLQHLIPSALVARAFVGGNRRAAFGVYNFPSDRGR